MITRYDLMEPAVSSDIDNDSFPDILSLNYKKALESNEFSSPPLQYIIDEMFIQKPYMYMYMYYSTKNDITIIDGKGQVYLDDILFDLNNIKHKDTLQDGYTFLFPEARELQTFISARIKNR